MNSKAFDTPNRQASENARAEAVASTLITEHWDCNIPIDPEGYARRLGLRVEHCENLGLKTGVLDAEHLLIRVNAKTAPEHRRFAVARELGRFCLGYGKPEKGTDEPPVFHVHPERDRAADAFASALLIPAVALKAMVEVRNVKDPVALRRAFGVSSQVLYRRLEALGYFL